MMELYVTGGILIFVLILVYLLIQSDRKATERKEEIKIMEAKEIIREKINSVDSSHLSDSDIDKLFKSKRNMS